MFCFFQTIQEPFALVFALLLLIICPSAMSVCIYKSCKTLLLFYIVSACLDLPKYSLFSSFTPTSFTFHLRSFFFFLENFQHFLWCGFVGVVMSSFVCLKMSFFFLFLKTIFIRSRVVVFSFQHLDNTSVLVFWPPLILLSSQLLAYCFFKVVFFSNCF